MCYANNEVFNPHPSNVATNEMPGTFPSRRAAFMGDNSKGIHLVNFTVKTTAKGQAEGLLLAGEQNIVSNVNIEGSGDALQVNGSVYLTDCRIVGDGDIILGRGPAFFNHCELISNGGTYMWIRNTSANHGNVFLNCRFQTIGARRDRNRPCAHQQRQGLPILRSGVDQLRPCGHQPRRGGVR